MEDQLVYSDYDEEVSDVPYASDSYTDSYVGDYTDRHPNVYTRISIGELLDRCIIPTLSQTFGALCPIILLCFVQRTLLRFTKEGSSIHISDRMYHACSTLLGLTAAYLLFHEHVLYLAMFTILLYNLLRLTYHQLPPGWNGPSVVMISAVYLITCEVFVVEPREWHQIRGAQMILAMKLISLAFDLDQRSSVQLPSAFEFFGYSFHVGSIIFGPWINYKDYANLRVNADRKFWSTKWSLKILKSFFLCLLCLIYSTCFIHWLILDVSGRWFIAYRDAQSFRFSHYFVCYMSEVTLVMSGLGSSQAKSNGDVRWDLATVKPCNIEMPRSLVDVVVNWNIPMHNWLKHYVFRSAKPFGKLQAILCTYIASALLHGLTFQLATVLLSLGVFSYLEFTLRQRLAKIFDACVESRKCARECKHYHTPRHTYVILGNVCFLLLAIFHLTYLGLMFDNSAQQEEGYSMFHTLIKWSELSFASHWIAFGTLVFYFLI